VVKIDAPAAIAPQVAVTFASLRNAGVASAEVS